MSKKVVDDVAVTPAPARHRSVLLVSLLVNNLVLFAVYAGVLGVLLPQQVSDIDPAHKVGNLALVTSLSALATLFVQPIVGALSDRTRSRFGRRSPWIVVGGIGGGLCTVAMQFGHTVLAIAAIWVLAQVLLNALQGPTTAVVADRVEPSGRGVASAFQGAGLAIGAAAGITFAGRQLHRIGVGYTVLGLAAIVMTVLFVLINRDTPSTGQVPRPFRWGAFLRGFWVSPRRHPDYAWAFGGRFFMVLGYQAIQNYTLYILTDYIGLGSADAGALYGVLSMISSVTMVIGTVVFGKLSDMLGRRKVFVFTATIVLAAAVAVPLAVPTSGAMLVYAALSGIGYGAYIAVDLALMIDVLPSQGDMARDLGVLNIASNVPQTLTPLIAAGLLGAFAGDYGSIFVYAIVAVVFSSLFVLPIKSAR
ncbi:MFS transporter [Actinoplanes sp. OR16]|uniref:MFS transporter n=1 Tax=Actinoplanes sp. OR16 TaxID=946334 RepID=UPI000F6C9F3E|nr:MFS transporter [Actinoplanes sp. OR16]BBH67898.1 MFS transporter [Actinoplanes sp. OR16]